MPRLFQNKYRVDTVRLRSWNYGSNAKYFVTLNSKNRVRYFGEVVNRKMILSEIGLIAKSCWYEIPEHFPFVRLDFFQIMPDHIHGIIEINKPYDLLKLSYSEYDERKMEPYSHSYFQFPAFNKFGPQSQNLPSIVRGYKVGVTKEARELLPGFKWLSGYHDRIIRTKSDLLAIRKYIENKPKNWKG